MATTRETLVTFENRSQVSHIIDPEKKSEAWLTPTTNFTNLKNKLGADSVDVSEDGKRIFFYAGAEVVGDYRLANSLQGSTPAELVAEKHCLLFFESWYPAEKRWVLNCAKGTPRAKSANAVSI
jgi:hypothetical protein